MGARICESSRLARTKPPSWKLTAPTDGQTQGIVVSGFAELPSARALFLFCDWPENGDGTGYSGKGAWLRALKTSRPITDCDGRDERAAILAFTWTGLPKSGLGPEALSTFSGPFREGMYQEDRLRRIGDRTKAQWQDSVIAGGPLWSGNTPSATRRPPAWSARLRRPRPARRSPCQVRTPKTVHALLMLYPPTRPPSGMAGAVATALAPTRFASSMSWRSACSRMREIAREHFGFADGMSQPVPFGGNAADSVVFGDGRRCRSDPWHGVPLGEILFGHTNAHAEKAPGPLVPDDRVAREAELPQEGAPAGYLNFGLNGSYMVVRELRQYVAGFWQNLEDNATRIHAARSERDPRHRRLAGRAHRRPHRRRPSALSGGTLPPTNTRCRRTPSASRGPTRTATAARPAAHVRRSNPRDGWRRRRPRRDAARRRQQPQDPAPRPRLWRPAARPRTEDGTERGLLFVCLNSDIARQFEFIQQTWILNRNFATLYDETDPLVGPKGWLHHRRASRCAASSRWRPSSRWPAASISSCPACRPSTIWRACERARRRRPAAASQQVQGRADDLGDGARAVRLSPSAHDLADSRARASSWS